MGMQVGCIIIMRRRTQKQQRQREAEPSQPPWELLPSATIHTYLHLHASPYSPNTSPYSISKKTPPLPPSSPSQSGINIELHPDRPNNITFHHRQKMNAISFHFDHVFDSKTKPQQAASTLDLSRTLLDDGKDFCVIVMGCQQGNLSEFCGGGEGMGDSPGLLFQMLSQLWDRMQAMKTEQSSPGINSIRLSLKMLAVEEDRLFDMLSPKTEVTIKDSPTRAVITSTNFPVMSVYDLHVKLQEIFHQRKLLYPDSAAVFEAEVTISYESYLITEEAVTTRLFTFIQWPRGSRETPTLQSHNNQALLTLNMCIYELYKLSLHLPEKINRTEARQLWAHFRNSHLTMLIKHYFMGNSRMALMGCLPLQGQQENENYQLLMLAKNLAKIDLRKFEECVMPVTHAPTPPLVQEHKTHKKMKTEPVEISGSRGLSPEFTPSPPNMRKLKQNLQRILKEKQSFQQRQKEEELTLLFKERKECRLQLQNIRYKKEEIRIRQDYGKLSHHHSRILPPPSDPPTLPLLQGRKQSKPSAEELARLAKEEESALIKIDSLQAKIVGSISNAPAGRTGVNALRMEVRLQERELVQGIAHKSRILAMLKGQLREMNLQDNHPQTPKRKRRYRKSRSDHVPPIHRTIEDQQQTVPPQQPAGNPEQTYHQQDLHSATPDPPARQEGFRLQTLKKLNKNNYMFEKRRMALKAKLSKGRQEVNEFYENAAKKFQEYRPK